MLWIRFSILVLLAISIFQSWSIYNLKEEVQWMRDEVNWQRQAIAYDQQKLAALISWLSANRGAQPNDTFDRAIPNRTTARDIADRM